MSNRFAVDSEALAEAVARMAKFERDVEAGLAEVDSMVANLHVAWTGEGAAAQAHRQWALGAAMMREALARLGAAGAAAASP